MSQRIPVRCCGDLRNAADSFNCFIVFKPKSFMKFTGILFDVSEGLLTLKPPNVMV